MGSIGMVVALAYQGGVPWFRFEIPAARMDSHDIGSSGARYIYTHHLPGPGIKKWIVRKLWKYGQLQYLINGRALVPAPDANRLDIRQQVTLGDQAFTSTQPWATRKAYRLLGDTTMPVER